MKKYLLILSFMALLTACSDDEKGGPGQNNINNLVLTVQKITTPVAPKNPGNYSVWFAMAGRNIFYINPSNTAEPQFMLSYNIDTNAFTTKLPHNEVCGCGYSSKIVSDGSSLYYIANEAFKYSISNNTWSELSYPANAKDNNGEAGIVSLNGRIYFLGGRDATTKFKYYDTATDSWFNASDYMYSVGTPDLVTANSKIYALGGGGQNNKSKFSVYTEGEGWKALPDLVFESPNSYGTHTVASFQNKYIFVITYPGQFYIYDVENNKWRDEPIALDNLQNSYINLFSDNEYLYAVSKSSSNDFSLHKISISSN